MAHELYIQNGEASMFYIGEAPWHGLGTKLENPATATEAIRAARLDWQVTKKPLAAVDGIAVLSLPGRYAVVREDLWGTPECAVLGLVGRDYTPLQNSQAFEFFDPIAGKGAAIYHTAGALGKGERVWILAKLPSVIRIAGDDIVEKYLLLSNSHEGTSSVQIKLTPIRVVCQNTLTMALKDGPTVRVSHTRDVHQRLRDAERMLGLIESHYGHIEEVFKAMVEVNLPKPRLMEYLSHVFPDPPDPENERVVKRVKNDREWVEFFFVQGKGNQSRDVAGTLWAAYNGITEYVDHRSTAQSADRRLISLWFGEGYQIKARAFRVAEAKIAAWAN